MNFNLFPHYKVGDQKYINRHRAWIEHHRTGLAVEFDLYESVFDCSDWSTEPSQSWDELLDARARQIESLGRPIVLGYSGGTDSHTIYQVFRRLDIKIAAVVIRTRKGWEYELSFRPAIEFMQKQSDQHGFALCVLDEDAKYYENFYANSEWIWDNKNYSNRFGHNTQLSSDLDRLCPGLVNEDYVYINGLEKPKIKILNGKFHSFQNGITWCGIGDDLRSQSFYVTPYMPELHIKQSYMVARFIVEMARSRQRPITDFLNLHTWLHDYYTYAIDACGRFGELVHTPIQKIMVRDSKIFLPNNSHWQRALYKGRSEGFFMEGIRRGDAYAHNYINGLLEIKSQPALRDFWRGHDFHRCPIPLSKSYPLEIDLSSDDIHAVDTSHRVSYNNQ